MKGLLQKGKRLLHSLERHLGRRNIATGCLFVALTSLVMTLVLLLTQGLAQLVPDIGRHFDARQLVQVQLLSAVMVVFYAGVAGYGWRHSRAEAAPLWLAYLLTTLMLAATTWIAILYGLKDTPMSLLLISAVALARAWFPPRVLVPGVIIAIAMIVASEVLMHQGMLRYAPLLTAPVVHSDTIVPWWRNWSEGIYNLVALFFSGLMFFIFWLMDGHNEQLEKLARDDALTGLVNRGTFMHGVDAACAARREGAPAACVMLCDIDHFRTLNAQQGQQACDRVLRRIAGFLKEMATSHDALAARYGGGAFALLLPGMDGAAARKLAARLAEYLATPPVDAGAEYFAVTMSVGIAEDRQGDPSALLKAADDDLYAAKLAANTLAAVAVATSLPERE